LNPDFAGILLLFSGALHIVAYILTSDGPGSIPVLAFGVIYLAVGLLLSTGKSTRLHRDYCTVYSAL